MTLEEKIVQRLEDNGIAYEIHEHEPVYTNPTMAEALGVTEAETVKSLVLSTKEKTLVVMVMPGNKKVDWKAAAKTVGTKKVTFAKPDVVSGAVGCEVGCVPPFGHMSDLPVFVDADLLRKTHVYFNPGVHHKSFKVASRDLKRLCQTK
jgi:Ala-tRNA(Pro) deacylase